MKKNTSDIIFTAGAAIFTLITSQLGILVTSKYPETPYVGLSITVLSILLFFTSLHFFRKKKEDDKIEELNKNLEAQGELLNTLKDIVILKKVSKI